MNFSNETVSVLKNFSTINQNLVIKSGDSISTISAQKNIVATAKVKETFPMDFAIYDLNEFLAAMSLFANPNLEFENDFVLITESWSSNKFLKYWYSDPSVVTTPTREITMPDCEVSFSLNSDMLSEVQKAASVIGAPDMGLEAMSVGKATLKVTDKKNSTANDYGVGIDVNNEDGQDVSYKFWFKVENLKLLSGTYDVQLSSKNISHFINSNVDVQYWIALEPESKYDD